MSKTKVYFTLVILFWFAVIAATPLYLDPLVERISPDASGAPQIRYVSNPKIISGAGFQNSTCKFAVPQQKSIILRMDDVQAWAWNGIVINLTDTVLSRNMSIALGVIPKNIDRDPLIKNYLLGKSDDPRIEIAQHGTNHEQNEFRNLGGKEAFNRTSEGLQKIAQAFGEYPVTFIPPNNEYNGNTATALSRLGFHVISARNAEYKFDGKIIYAGYTAMAKSADKAELNPVSSVLEACNTALRLNNICVVLMHPQDYAAADKKTVDAGRYAEFLRLLTGLESTGARFMTFRDLTEC